MGKKSDYTAKITDGYTFSPIARIQFENEFSCSFCNGRGNKALFIKRDDGREYKVGADCVRHTGLTERSFNGFPQWSDSHYEEYKEKNSTPKPKPALDIPGVFVGAFVRHESPVRRESFGDGVVMEVKTDRVIVRFEHSERTLSHPDTFAKGLLSLID